MNPIKIVNTQRPEILDIRWVINNVCNYQCRYCFPGSHEGDYKSPQDLDLIIRNFNALLKEYKEKLGKTKIHLKLSGGEPTLWSNLAIFIQEVKKENDIYFSLISNGSRTLRWWQEYGHLIDNSNLSLHVAQADVDHMIKVADTLHSLGKKVSVNVLMDPYHWDKCVDTVEYMKVNSKEQWFISVVEVQEPEPMILNKFVIKEDKKYTQEQLEYMKDSRKRLPPDDWFVKNDFLLTDGTIRNYESIAHFKDGSIVDAEPNYYLINSFNYFVGWECNIGIESVSIHHDGNIQGSCSKKLFGLDYYFNILDKDFAEKFKIEPKPVICDLKLCICQPETHISKTKLG